MMQLTMFILLALSCSKPSFGQDSGALGDGACALIAQSISSSSAVYYPSNLLSFTTYQKDIYHWASSATQQAKCSIEPGTAADVGKIVSISDPELSIAQLILSHQLQILDSTRTP